MYQLSESARTPSLEMARQLDNLVAADDGDDMVEEELLEPGKKKRGWCSQEVYFCFGVLRTTRGRYFGGCCCCSALSVYVYLSVVLTFVAQSREYPGSTHPDAQVKCRSFSFVSNYDGRVLEGCRQPLAEPARAAMLFFHGNAGTVSSGIMQAAQILVPQYSMPDAPPPIEIFSFSYRGYPPNNGSSWRGQSKIVADAEALLDSVLKTDVGGGKQGAEADGRVIVGGWSLGAAVALQLAARRPESVAGLVVVSPFDSMWSMALYVFGYYLSPWIWVSDHWDSLGAAQSLPEDIPVAVLSAGMDMEIPPFMHRHVSWVGSNLPMTDPVGRGALPGQGRSCVRPPANPSANSI